ncbi:hypothetical protein AMJ49_02840 [Parcubacteria bacterium DG_74_2]|nr:MAG: hypothetical protein AMJ49_02840 [Parcubacteria bacterium DG_74_2]
MSGTGQNILFKWIFWHFYDVPKEILKAWKNFLKFNLNYFSVPLLSRTFFYYWRGYRWSYGRGFDLGRYAETFVSNMISRILGAFLRSILIVIGIVTEIFFFFLGLILFFSWFFLPIVLLVSFFYGFRFLF